jgi:hypothetical protein
LVAIGVHSEKKEKRRETEEKERTLNTLIATG